MRAIEFLLQLKKLDKMIENKLIEKESWKAMATGTTAQMGGERVQSSGNQQKMETAVVKFIEIEHEIDDCIDEMIDTKQDVISVLEQLNASEYDLLHKMYVQCFTLQEIADMNDRSISWAKATRRRGIKNVQRILDQREECPKVSKSVQSYTT